MSEYNIYIDAPQYLADWLRNEFWSEESGRVEFPRGSAERIIMELYLKKVPKDYCHTKTEGKIPVEVPTFKGKNPAVYNHLPQSATALLLSTIKRRFKLMMWNELHAVFRKHDVEISDMVYAFLEKHGIEPSATNHETVRQMYRRMRIVYENNVKS